VGAIEEKFYQNFLTTIGYHPSDDHSQFNIEKWPEMVEMISAIIRGKTRDEWVKLFDGVDACVTPVLEYDEAPLLEMHRERGGFDSSTGMPNPAPKLSRTPAERDARQPVSSITQTVLTELGYSSDEIRKLQDDGVIDDPESDDEA